MKKSIYYLIANILSTITAAIFIAIVNQQYPLLGTNFTVTKFTDIWESMKYILPVVTLSIIVTTRDIALNKEDSKLTALDKTLSTITAILTIISIFYTWVFAILSYDHYTVGQQISIPFAFIISYIIGITMIYLTPIISKKNANLGLTFIFTAIILIIASIVYECLDAYILAGIISYAVVLIIFIIGLIISSKKVSK